MKTIKSIIFPIFFCMLSGIVAGESIKVRRPDGWRNIPGNSSFHWDYLVIVDSIEAKNAMRVWVRINDQLRQRDKTEASIDVVQANILDQCIFLTIRSSYKDTIDLEVAFSQLELGAGQYADAFKRKAWINWHANLVQHAKRDIWNEFLPVELKSICVTDKLHPENDNMFEHN